MITIRRADERRLDRVGQSEVWSVFTPRDPPGPAYPQDALGLTPDKVEPSAAAVDPRVGSTAEAARRLGAGFGTLTRLIEARLAPGSSFPASRRVKHDVILVSYVREGSIAYQDTEGRSGVVLAGEFHVLTVRSGGRYRHRNASQRAWVTAFQVALRPSSDAELADSSEVQRFSAAERRGGLCVVASADGRRASMRMPGDAMVFSALIARGQHVAYEIVAGRGVWLQLVHGSVRLDDINLTAGDGAGLTGEPSVSFTAREQTEVLLIDVVHLHPPTNPTHVVIGGAVAASPANDGDPSNPAPPSPEPDDQPKGEAPMRLKSNPLILSLVLGGLGALVAAGCAKAQTCDDLIARLCADYPDRCGDARTWVDAQYGGADGRVTDADRPNADATCAAVLESEVTLAAFTRRFADSRAPAAVAPRVAPVTATPAPSPSTQDRVRTAGEVAEEAGKAAEKAGEAFDKLEDALKRE